jgi:hypothetical protein
MLRPTMAIITRHKHHYKEILHMYYKGISTIRNLDQSNIRCIVR